MQAQRMLFTTALVISIMTIRLSEAGGIKTCEYDDSACGCKSDLGLISLKKFANRRFQAPGTPSEHNVYYWNPCKDFRQGMQTASCIQSYSVSMNYDCGAHSSMTTTVENGKPVFKMRSVDNARRSEVTCVCGDGNKLKFTGEQPQLTYKMTFTSQSCCPPSSGSGSGGLSAGSVMVIVFFCVLVVYLVAGFAFLAGVRKAEGKERIPNVAFWSTVPGLIRDGFVFTISRGKRSSYQEV